MQAFVPGTKRQQNYPSTVAYMAQLIIHRYAMLGVLDEQGYSLREMGILEAPREHSDAKLMHGSLCAECGNNLPGPGWPPQDDEAPALARHIPAGDEVVHDAAHHLARGAYAVGDALLTEGRRPAILCGVE